MDKQKQSTDPKDATVVFAYLRRNKYLLKKRVFREMYKKAAEHADTKLVSGLDSKTKTIIQDKSGRFWDFGDLSKTIEQDPPKLTSLDAGGKDAG